MPRPRSQKKRTRGRRKTAAPAPGVLRLGGALLVAAARLPWLAAALGVLVAWLWGDGSRTWLLCGALIGIASELAGARIAARERTAAGRVIAFFLSFQTLLTLVPFMVFAGFIAWSRSPATIGPVALLVIPLGAAVLAGIRFVTPLPGLELDPPADDDEPEGGARRWVWIFGALALVVAIAYADNHIPAPYSLDFLYLPPVLLVTWATGAWGGLLLAAFAAEARGIARGFSYLGELSPGFSALDSLLVAAGLASAALLLSRIQSGLERERTAARTDPLTGLINRKAFLERVETEISRAQRYQRPLSVAYLDLDGFKAVNDAHGHAAGDEVLKIVASVLLNCIREQDVAARLGGDEFAILLPETDPDTAPRVVERVRAQIEDQMLDYQWPVTCSAGMVTTGQTVASVDELLHRADELMYQVKHDGKNALRQVVLSAPPTTGSRTR